MSATLHPAAPHDLPPFITAPGSTDVLFVITTSFIIGMVLLVGVIFFWLHSLPERVAHKSKKFQFEIVAILGLISLLTHQHIFWIAGLLLAYIELPNFSHPLRSMAHSLEQLAGKPKGDEAPPEGPPVSVPRSLDDRETALPQLTPDQVPPAMRAEKTDA